MGKVLSYGELLLRICPDAEGSWLKENGLPFYVGGAELNVATALALWEVPSAYFTALPDNFMSKQLVEYVDELKIDTSAIQFQGDRIGLYYLHKGKDLKNSGVIYDRAHSSFAEIKLNTINWDEVLKDVSWFHFSAICPALSQAAADLCEEVLKEASARNISISIDLNYRAKLWQYGKQPGEVLPALAKYCTLIMGNLWAAERMLNIPVREGLVEEDQKKAYLEQAKTTSEELMKQYPKCTAVANTFRFDVGKGIRYYTTLYTEGKLNVSTEYTAEAIVDKVGSGDCYMAGLIYGFYKELPAAEVLEFATAAAFSKLFVESDATNIKADEVKEKVKNYVNEAVSF
ncbi:sugar kinase [Pedobacter sp. MC2016-14]|uniref:sugar kinase n=1 Tax=Pedobacter sp. MC2016-14 TaxID=2897327 RepID=UPI001E31323B|nr:sugar kinase [Pedobacter sp. MC2016-14]MCD0488734.1 sugar kinase [Pedobacter sp. MC2016-14]